MLDQQVAAAWPVCQQRAHVLKSFEVDLPALRRARRTAATLRG
jgi:hypothetical protein